MGDEGTCLYDFTAPCYTQGPAYTHPLHPRGVAVVIMYVTLVYGSYKGLRITTACCGEYRT